MIDEPEKIAILEMCQTIIDNEVRPHLQANLPGAGVELYWNAQYRFFVFDIWCDSLGITVSRTLLEGDPLSWPISNMSQYLMEKATDAIELLKEHNHEQGTTEQTSCSFDA